MNRHVPMLAFVLLAGSWSFLAVATQSAGGTPKKTQSGIIVAGENGTKWCCPDGVKGPKCEQGANSTPVGAACNFASALVVDTSITPTMSDRGKAVLKPQAEDPRVAPTVLHDGRAVPRK